MNRGYLLAIVGIAAFAVLFVIAEGAEAEPDNVMSADVTGSAFTVSWTTAVSEQGNMTWATNEDMNPDFSTNWSAEGSATYLHRTNATGLTLSTTYYYYVYSETTWWGQNDSTGVPQAYGVGTKPFNETTGASGTPGSSYLVYGNVTNVTSQNASYVTVFVIEQATGDAFSCAADVNGTYVINVYGITGTIWVEIEGADNGYYNSTATILGGGSPEDLGSFLLAPYEPADIKIIPPGPADYVAGGAGATYTATVYDAFGNENTTATVTWGFFNNQTDPGAGAPSMNATIDSSTGVFDTGYYTGTGNVTATAGSASNLSAFTVSPNDPFTVTISGGSIMYTAGGAGATYSALVEDEYGNDNSSATVIWGFVDGDKVSGPGNGGAIEWSIDGAGQLTPGQYTGHGNVSVNVTGFLAVSDTSMFFVNASSPDDLVISGGAGPYTAGGAGATYTATVLDVYDNVNYTSIVAWSFVDVDNATSAGAGGAINWTIDPVTGVFD